jgi:beta-N-acetylhexosaminidase
VLKELRRVPPGFAAFLVVGAAVVTMLILAAFDGSVGSSTPSVIRKEAARARQPVITLGQRYAKPKKKAVAPEQEAPATPQPAPAQTKVPLRRLVGQKLIARISGTSASPAFLRRVRRGEVGGVILFPDNVGSPAQLRALTASLSGAASAGGSPGFIVSVDQEGGPVKRLAAGPPTRAPAQISSVAQAQGEGAATGSYLSGLGVNVDLAPVLDVRRPGSFVASRAFAATPGKVAALGGAFASGLQQAGVAATAKHFPGLGHAVVNTDRTASVVSSPRAILDADLEPFSRAAANQIGLVMMSNATYPAYAPGPAVLAPSIVQGLLRGRLGFQGVIISDDLEAGAVTSVMPPSSAAVSAARAGVDMLLLARSEASYPIAYGALLAAARDGRLSRASLEASYQRIQQLQTAYAH